MGDLMAQMGKVAAMNHLAVLLTSQTSTRVSHESSALLVPALSSTAWDGGIASRLVLFRDWPLFGQDEQEGPFSDLRFVGVLKTRGVVYDGSSVGRIVPFTIDDVSIS